MHFTRPIRCLLIAFLFTAALAVVSLPCKGSSTESTLMIPGGFQAAARMVGLDESLADPASGIERIFTAVLESESPAGSASQINGVESELIFFLKEYGQFIRFLQGEHLVPQDYPASGESLELIFPFRGKREDLLRTRKLLSYFGIASRIRTGDADGTGLIETGEDRSASKQLALYRGLGLQLTHGDIDQVSITVRRERMPMPFGVKGWDRILSEKSPDYLFQRFVENPGAMRLWLALAACSQATRDALMSSVEPGRLLKYSEALLLFGPDLRFEHATLVFPGSREAWAGLPSSPALSVNSLLSDGGTPLLLYSALWSAPPEVQNYLTASPARLRNFFSVLKPYGLLGFWGSVGAAAGQDLPRILRLLKVDSRGLVLNLQDRIASPLLYWRAPSELAAASGSIAVTPRVLARLLPRLGVSPYAVTSFAEILEFFRYIEETYPESVSADSATALTRSPEEVPVFLDLIGDLAPDATLLSKYLEYCNTTAAQGTENWNANRTRTSQAIFFLISALRREGTLSQDRARALLEHALNAFSSEDEASFAFATARFLSAELMPEITRKECGSRDPLLLALSGNKPPLRVPYEGKELALDLTVRNYLRMRKTMQTQSYTPVPVLLQIYAVLQEIKSAGANKANADEKMRLLSKLLDGIRTAEWTPGGSSEGADVAQVDIDALKRKIASAGSWAGARTAAATSAEEIAARIHTELGVTLLSYCYAYSAAPDIDVLAYDPNFVRKHRFYASQKSFWRSSHFVQEEELGGLIEGSLAGLGFEMTRLQIAQSGRNYGISANIDLAPAILFGFRHVRPNLRTDRSQEYVALATQLGRSLVNLPSVEEPLGKWLKAELNLLLSQQRLEKIQQFPVRKDFAAAILSRSELFLLGEAYYKSTDWRSDRCPDETACATIARLNEIVPTPGSPEYNSFRDEVSQYGVSLRSRIGLTRFSFAMIDPYERLERNIRPEALYDRICDLKIRIAELNSALGLPAALGEVEADLALQSILPQSPIGTAEDWKYTIRQINGLSEKAAMGWIHDLIARGSLDSGLPDTDKIPEL